MFRKPALPSTATGAASHQNNVKQLLEKIEEADAMTLFITTKRWSML